MEDFDHSSLIAEERDCNSSSAKVASRIFDKDVGPHDLTNDSLISFSIDDSLLPEEL